MEFFKKLFFKKTKLQSEKIEKILNSQKNILIVIIFELHLQP